jgi:hypothetical protein
MLIKSAQYLSEVNFGLLPILSFVNEKWLPFYSVMMWPVTVRAEKPNLTSLG